MTIKEQIIKRVKQAAFNYKISQNPYNDTKGIYFKGKIRAYGEITKLLKNVDQDTRKENKIS